MRRRRQNEPRPTGGCLAQTGPPGRLYYQDWLRVMAIPAVFAIHSAKIFDYDTTDVFNVV
jgi:hypothetical protein